VLIVLTASSTGDNEVVSLEVAEVGERARKTRDWIRLTGSGLPGGWVNIEKLTIINYKYDIRILLMIQLFNIIVIYTRK